MADTALGHDGDGDCVLDVLDDPGVRHDRDCAGVFSNLRLLCSHHVHYDAALEHLCESCLNLPCPLVHLSPSLVSCDGIALGVKFSLRKR